MLSKIKDVLMVLGMGYILFILSYLHLQIKVKEDNQIKHIDEVIKISKEQLIDARMLYRQFNTLILSREGSYNNE